MDPLIGGALIGSAASGLSSALGNIGNRRSQERARAHDINMWDRTNNYNHPSQQMARLRSAGLNPNMVYGGSSGQTAGTAGSIPGAKAPDYNMELGGPFQRYVNLKNTEAQTDNLRTQNGVLAADQNLKDAQAITEVSKQGDLEASAEFKKESTNLVVKNILKNIAEKSGIDLDNTYKGYENKWAKKGFFRGDNDSKTLIKGGTELFNYIKNGTFRN